MTTYEKNLIWEVEFLTRIVTGSTDYLRECQASPTNSYLRWVAGLEVITLSKNVDRLNAAIEKLEAYRALPFWKKMFIK